MKDPDPIEGEHNCSNFRRHNVGKKYVYRCDGCKRDYTADEMRTITRGITIRPAETETSPLGPTAENSPPTTHYL